MAEFEVIDSRMLPELSGHGAPFTRSRGSMRSTFYAPDDFGQFVVHASLTPGATLSWDAEHGDEGLMVLEGELLVDGRRVGPKDAVLVESCAAAVLEAATDVRLLHVGSTVPGPVTASVLGPPDTRSRAVHVCDPDTTVVQRYELPPIEVDGVAHDDVVNTAWFADGRCPGCRIAFFRVWGDGPHRGVSHSHSAHELITVTAGEIQVGRDRIEAGMTAAIPADRRYGFRTSAPWEFVNSRCDASYITRNPADPPAFDGPTAAADD